MRVGRGRIVCIVGPTAIGKTALAIALARKIGGEIVSADSMQIYKGMPILSQAPCRRQLKRVRHHLVGYLDPRADGTVGAFRARGMAAVRSILRRKKIPVVVGGSGLYVKALVDGLFPAPGADLGFRKKMQAYAARYGRCRLHAKLERIDPVSASKIHPNDARRTIRSLEIFHATGRTMTDLAAATRGLKHEHDILLFGLNRPRHQLYAAIDARVDRMFRNGAVGEVRRLRKKRLSTTADSVLGYKEILGALEGERSLDEAKALLQMNTRRFAKRQLSWFRADKRIRWFDLNASTHKRIVQRIVKEMAPWKKRS